MATVFQPPFYVPRPPDPTFWVGSARQSPEALLSWTPGTPLTLPAHRFDYQIEAGIWLGSSQGLPPALLSSLLQLYFASPQWEPVGDQTTAYWSPQRERNLALLSSLGAPATPLTLPAHRFDYQVDGPIWLGQPQRSATISLLTAVQFFGAGGQAPTKQWHWDYQVDGPLWFGTPRASLTLGLPATVTFFGAAGQAPTKQWRYDYQIDGPLWLGTPQHAAPLSLLTAVKFFGGGGQAPTKRWRYDYQIDAPIWVGHPLAAYLANVPGPPVPPVSSATDYIMRARRRRGRSG